MNVIKKVIQYGDQTITLETGEIARQATGAVMCSMGDTQLLVTVVGSRKEDPSRDFFPLTVNYQERTYSAGKIPGGFFKREGRPTEKETLTCRLIDRPVRPLFPKGFTNEVQVVATVVSLDKNINADIPALIGTSAALCISGLPFGGPIAAARVGYKDGNYILNPTVEALESSELDLVVAGTGKAVLMVESEANELSEDIMLGSVLYGHEQMQTVISAINEFAAEAGKEKWDWQPAAKDEALVQAVKESSETDIIAAYQIQEKAARQDKVKAVRDAAIEKLSVAGDDGTIEWDASAIGNEIHAIEKRVVRSQVLEGQPRIDGRDTRTVRPITVKTGILPRVHGSALFTRGETQAIVTTTLGTQRDAQIIDAVEGEYKDPFMLHYNFPPYCVGETGFMSGPKRREIGHGRLARRGIAAMLPDMTDYPYTIRVVSEITESNGSSSMASVCGTSLALMDAGVEVKSPVAGIAMGLIKEDDKFAVLSDILGDEDHLGDMDFKVAGTANGITALQMDIKIDGITREVMTQALSQAKEGRLHILGEMNKVLDAPRTELSDFAPRILTIKIKPAKIAEVIGKGGATIRAITEETGATIDISDDGLVKIACTDSEGAQAALTKVEQITADAEVGAIYDGRVAKLMDFGAFVTILPGKDGLVHISQICEERVENVSDKLSEGDMIKVKVLEVDKQGRIRLSMKAVGA